MEITRNIIISLVLFLSTAAAHYSNNKPWPTYSLQNMPRTSFTCRSKILGGYYADSETQCQMFHVCVKVAGVGVQDFRFLCPNGTAFDQEAQICADWGDVDCEESTLYYSSDNFDLHRLGSGFESKRFEEDESTYHLQRAETNDARRTKPTIPNQNGISQKVSIFKQNPDIQPSKSYSKQPIDVRIGHEQNSFDHNSFATTTAGKKLINIKTTVQPIQQNYGPIKNSEYDSDNRQDEEIFKGAHSSNFFNNRNNGKEDDLVDFNKQLSVTPRSSPKPRHRGRNTFRGNYQGNNNNITPAPQKPASVSVSTTTAPPKIEIITEQYNRPATSNVQNNVKKVTLQSSFRTESLTFNDNSQNYSTPSVPAQQSSVNSFSSPQYQTPPTRPAHLQRIQPTTYNPPFNILQIRTSTASYDDFKPIQSTEKQLELNSNTRQFSQPNKNPFYNTQYEQKANEQNFPTSTQYSVQPRRQGTQERFYSSQDLNSTAVANRFDNDYRVKPDEDTRPAITTNQPQTANTGRYFVRNQNIRQPKKPSNYYNTERPNGDHNKNNRQNSNNTTTERQPNTYRHLARERSRFQNFNYEAYQVAKNDRIDLARTKQNENRGRNHPVKSYNQQYHEDQYDRKVASSTPNTNQNSLRPSNLIQAPHVQPQAQPIQSQTHNVQPQTHRNQPQPYNNQQQTPTLTDQVPRAFKQLPQEGYSDTTGRDYSPSSPNPSTYVSSTPEQFSQDRYQPISRTSESYTPSTVAKKFSTLVPKDQYYPTTFKPTTYKKHIDGYNQKISKSTNPAKFTASSYIPTQRPVVITTTSPPPANPNPSEQIDEDDGQYHPELYEKDFVRNKLKSKQSQRNKHPKPQPTVNQQQNAHASSDEDEFFKTAHSLNIAAGINEFIAKNSKASSPNSTPREKSSGKPAKKNFEKSLAKSVPKDEDTSYDYAYYDSSASSPQDYSEYDVISEFGKTRKP